MKWLRRQSCFLEYTLSSLCRRKNKNLALLLVYTLVIFMLASVIFFTAAIRKEASALLETAPDIIVQRMVAGRHDLLPESYLEPIRHIRGIRSVEARLWGYYYHPAARSNYTLMAPGNFSHGDGTAEIGQGVAETWAAANEKGLFFKAYDGSTVVVSPKGVLDRSTELLTSDLVLVSATTFRRITGVPEGFATDLALRITNPRECQTIAEKIVQALPDSRPILKDEMARTYASLFNWRSGFVIVLLSSSLLAFSIFAWEKATGLTAEEKREIGVLKGLGWDSADILLMKTWESASISLAAFLAGTSAAYIHVYLNSAPLFKHALMGWSVLYPTFRLCPTISFYQLSILFSLTVLPYTLITLIPIWRASVTDPDIIMRQG